jgi:aryl sulfotransferase
MADMTPPQGQSYRGHITDTRRWECFHHRADDIFICTPAKCGTTWTQAICAMLVFGKADHGRQPGAISPWIDARFAPIEDYLTEVSAQTHRRFLKTHTPLDGIPYHADCTYLVVLRDPRDAYFSGRNHRENMTDHKMAAGSFPGGADAFETWLNHTREGDTWDFWTLEAVVHFFRSYWQYRNLPNIHLFHYSDMKRDLHDAIRRMADDLSVTYGNSELAAFVDAASFEQMKRKADQFAPESGTGFWKSESGFFSRGALRLWEEEWSAEEIVAFDRRIEALLSPAETTWLLNGGVVPD